MRFFILLLFLPVMYLQVISGQPVAEATDVNFWLEDDRIIVGYSIITHTPVEYFDVDLKFITETNEEIIPKALKGDIGKNVRVGTGKTIVWDPGMDQTVFSGNIKAVVTIIPSVIYSRGPSYAILSVAVPGLGGYFLEGNKIRPVAATIGTLGLMTYGIISKVQANRYYEDYKQGSDSDEFQELYEQANHAHHRYFISTRIAAAIWIADVIWVYRNGNRNKKAIRPLLQTSSGSGLTINYMNKEVQVGYRFIF